MDSTAKAENLFLMDVDTEAERALVNSRTDYGERSIKGLLCFLTCGELAGV